MAPADSNAQSDIVVVGGGMVGIAAAIALQQRGYRVLIVDPGDQQQRASYGNAGVISPASILPMAGPGIWPNLWQYASNRADALRLRYRDSLSLLGWGRRFLSASNESTRVQTAAQLQPLVSRAIKSHQALAQDLGTQAYLKNTGWLRLYPSADSYESSLSERQLFDQYKINYQVVNTSDINALEPFLTKSFPYGIFFPDALSIEQPGQLVHQAWKHFLQHGGKHVAGRVLDVQQVDNHVHIVTQTKQHFTASHAVIAAGVHSSTLVKRMGYRMPMVAERGYHIHCHLPPGVMLNRPVNDIGGAYVMAPNGKHMRLLTGVELAKPDSPPNLVQIKRVLHTAATTLPIEHTSRPSNASVWMGSRPSTPDGLPVIGRASRHPRVVFAFGHGHIGLSTGPVTGTLVADLIDQQPTLFSLDAFRADRFQN